MKSDQTASACERTLRSPDDSGSDLVPEGLQARCRHQAMVIDSLGEALSAFEQGARALKAENCALRAENERLRRHRHFASRPGGGVEGGEPAEVAIPIGVQAPGVARSVVAERLADHVAPSVLETALLLVSELVSNGVGHSGVPGGDVVVVRVQLWRDGCRPEVEDPGRDGVIAPQPPDPLRGGGWACSWCRRSAGAGGSSGSLRAGPVSGRSSHPHRSSRRRPQSRPACAARDRLETAAKQWARRAPLRRQPMKGSL